MIKKLTLLFFLNIILSAMVYFLWLYFLSVLKITDSTLSWSVFQAGTGEQ